MTRRKVLIALAGADYPSRDLYAAGAGADKIIAADGGADRVAEAGLRPDVVVGDMDSISTLPPDAEFHLDDDPSRTDCEKAVEYCERFHFGDELLISGVEGDRLDHVLSSLLTLGKSTIPMSVALRTGLGRFIHGGEKLTVNAPEASRISLIPLTPCSGVYFTGVEWQLIDSEISPEGALSISNVVRNGAACSIGAGTALLIVESKPNLWPSSVFR